MEFEKIKMKRLVLILTACMLLALGERTAVAGNSFSVKDLVDNYKPDILYFDGGIPFGQVGRSVVAYYYNRNMKWHDGKLEAVLNIKK